MFFKGISYNYSGKSLNFATEKKLSIVFVLEIFTKVNTELLSSQFL